MPYVLCNIAEGLRPSEITVEVRDNEGRSEFLRVDRDYVKALDGEKFLPVGIIFREADNVLIELPHEADSGANRLWVPRSSVRDVPARPAVAAT